MARRSHWGRYARHEIYLFAYQRVGLVGTKERRVDKLLCELAGYLDIRSYDISICGPKAKFDHRPEIINCIYGYRLNAGLRFY
jgi:hypothetical protein